MHDFLIQYCQNLRKKEFATKSESVSRLSDGLIVITLDEKARRKENVGLFRCWSSNEVAQLQRRYEDAKCFHYSHKRR